MSKLNSLACGTVPHEDICFVTHENFLNHRDTVASTGVLISRNLPFTTSNNMIRTFRHALSLDEVGTFTPISVI
jgi:uncharacterized protein (DUF2235 family)